MNYLVTFSAWNFMKEIELFLEVYLMFIITEPVLIVVILVSTIGKWKIFEKSGINRWKALIPVYSDYFLCKIAVGKIWPFIIWTGGVLYCAIVLYIVISNLFNFSLSKEMRTIMLRAILISVIVVLILVIVRTYIMYKLSKSFGYSILFTIGLVIFEPIFLCILGFDSSRYIGPNNIIYNSYASKSYSGNQKE